MITQQQAKVAAQWWGERVKAPTFNALSDEERRDPVNKGMLIAQMMAEMMPRTTTTEQVADFVARLEKALLQDEHLYCVGVDYGPDRILNDAAEAAGINTRLEAFPWKTQMLFRDGGVQVSLGYCGPIEELLIVEADA